MTVDCLMISLLIAFAFVVVAYCFDCCWLLVCLTVVVGLYVWILCVICLCGVAC